MSRIGLACLVVSLAVPVLAQQAQQSEAPKPPANSAISGIVVDSGTGEAVANVIVMLRAPAGIDIGSQPNQITDDKGRFAFVNLRPSLGYAITASKVGYLPGAHGRTTEPSDPPRLIPLKDNDWVSNIRVPIWKPGSISGMVRDENGEPVVGVFVRALVRFRVAGREELAASNVTLTDDRGIYRLPGLAPGRYVVQVPSVQASMSPGSPAPSSSTYEGVLEMDDTSRLVIGKFPLPPPPLNGRPRAYPIAFHPAATLVSQAETIDLKFGDNRPNVDVTLTPAPAVRVTGMVDAPPEALTQLTLRLLPAGLEGLGNGSEAATATVGPNGQFTFLNVPAGNYTIDAPSQVSEFTGANRVSSQTNFSAPPGTGPYSMTSQAPDPITGMQFTTTSYRGNAVNYSGRMPLTVGAAEMAGVVVRLRPNLTMTPRFVFENEPSQGRPVPPPNQWLPLVLDPAGGEAYLGRPRFTAAANSPTTISIAGILPGQYWIRLMANAGWMIKSVTWNGRDHTALPIDTTAADDLSGVVITITNAIPELSGTVRVTGDLKADDSLVVVFPVEPALWRNAGLNPARMKAANVIEGTYRMTSLPAGWYHIAAIERRHRATWIDPEFLAKIARSAVLVQLTWGGKANQDVFFTPVSK